MSVPTLILPPRFTDESIAMWRAAVRLGWKTHRLQSWRAPQDLKSERLILYGEPLFAAAVAQELGIALIEPTLDWVSRVPETYLKRWVRFSTLESARSLTHPTFVKPADDKCFESRVYSSGCQLPNEEKVSGTTPVLMAEQVTWEVEYRCFVREGQVLTMSPYIRNGDIARAPDGSWPAPPHEMSAAREFATRVLSDSAIPMPPATVLDVGLIDGRGWAVVEANAAWGSGLCACDPVQVLSVLERACVPADAISAVDAEWIRQDES